MIVGTRHSHKLLIWNINLGLIESFKYKFGFNLKKYVDWHHKDEIDIYIFIIIIKIRNPLPSLPNSSQKLKNFQHDWTRLKWTDSLFYIILVDILHYHFINIVCNKMIEE